jgi:uncharacterized membrane protein YhaH (DUF805 family)
MADLMSNKWINFYFSFQGRATRYDFNIPYALVIFIGYIAAALLDVTVAGVSIMSPSNGPFSNFWNLAIIIPTLAVTCRRLHDMNYSGWWQAGVYLSGAAVIGVVVVTMGAAFFMDPMTAGLTGIFVLLAILIAYLMFFIMLSVVRGTKGPNKYGPDLLEVIQ